ncbi:MULTISPECIES: succinate dehydrogenase, cytochrome b556 subunit [Methyloversatilis]|jgi:succinate dehydrogenase / fumarate reductase, cytochrome b subunit|uniref:succinate dehydrogenase, cytochrome b556 subunit n=1 Tax=Methyloversatilis TaxID=378210 RepID=UPI00035E579D|nr:MULTISPECIES: succinate dehydrogenase, cytochrome b556 subunit [Methyloversatilis]PZU52425.1 MAG: succinate dehydrogenase, cytochrome b556 subunit [Thauera sp.]MBC7205603.1 succinate dehydrogenase, cytochrome b556 subunit [Methyloversatilis sp.]MBL8466419.1 succinate dehydrogenase, cytochrome b556 subunit [Methyloversatilis discipulorum]MBT9517237.1 succinate dehydrogenase, cytochrome b556 subunit [Methyloversatilis discipulorum]MBV5284939.1 succinate dehydrogenase, cytochrome b556 subunit 
MANTASKTRPKHLQLTAIRLPLPGIVSILHRISGAGLFLCLPLLLWLFDASLGSPDTFESFSAVVGHPLAKLLLLGLMWAYLHHFCAGVRFLLLDMHKGLELATARKSSVAVLVVSLTLTVILGVKLW